MKWYWKVRLYNPKGGYYHTEIVTKQDFNEIQVICEFWKDLTGCTIIVEGMAETSSSCLTLHEAFECYHAST